MGIIVKAKHWQIFGTLMFVTIVNSVNNNASELIGDTSYTLLIGINIGWVLSLGTALKKRSENLRMVNYYLFLGAGILLIVFVGALRMLLTTEETFKIMDNSILNFAFGLYAIISIGVLYSFPAKILKSIETKGEVGINDYFGYMLLLIFWPIGIWFIQPRLNKIA